jgi:ribonuclease PH
MNVVMTGSGRFVEVQGTGENATFDREQLDKLIALAVRGTAALQAIQAKALRQRRPLAGRLRRRA